MQSYRWARAGDLNAFFGLMLDNAAVMVLMVGLITNPGLPESMRFTPEFVLTRMIPGTALGVMVGDLIYTWMAFRLARRTGRDDVTAMPLGLDTPSTIGIPLLVLLPALQRGNEMYPGDREQAQMFAWHVGVLILLASGLLKLALAPLGNAVRRMFPRAGLLGSLAAIALTLISFLPLLTEGIAAVPLVGMPALLVILITLVAHRELPGKFPGALAAVLVGTILYWVCHALREIAPLVPPPQAHVEAHVWQPSAWLDLYSGASSWWSAVLVFALGKLPVAFPFALATVIGGIDCTESAAAAGDEYDTTGILMAEAGSALLAASFGGVIQTTPYIGHPAYKKMGGRAAYTLANGLFIGAVGFLGGFTLLFDWLPGAAMFPILVFVGLEITAMSFHATPTRHYPALALAMMPALAYLITVPLGSALGADRDPAERGIVMVQTLRCLANGFLITGMLWAAALAMILDGRMRAAAVYYLVAAACAFVGVIHSPLANEQIGLPHTILEQVPTAFQSAVQYQTPYHWSGTYVLLALLTVLLGKEEPRPTGSEEPTA